MLRPCCWTAGLWFIVLSLLHNRRVVVYRFKSLLSQVYCVYLETCIADRPVVFFSSVI